MCTTGELFPDLTPIEETYTEQIRRIWHELDEKTRADSPLAAEERDRWIHEDQPYPTYLKHGKHCKLTFGGYGEDSKRHTR